jgi:PAS domain S-box-containing protein
MNPAPEMFVPHDSFKLNVRSASPELAALIESRDWSSTALGPVESWPTALRTMLEVALANRFPMVFWWGPELIQLYNDPYRPILGAKHPLSLGQPAKECWREIWDVIGPQIESIQNGGPSTWNEDLTLPMNRYGFIEETYFTFSYSPIPDPLSPSGVGGILATVQETTEKVIGDRRMTLLRNLAASETSVQTVEEACRLAAATLAESPTSVPFSMIYLVDESVSEARLAASSGVPAESQAAFRSIALAAESPWRLGEARRAEGLVVIDAIDRIFPRLPPGSWPEPPRRAVVVPIRSNASNEPAGFLIAGTNPRVAFDDRYRSFFELIGAQVASAVARASAFEEERRRAEALAELNRAKTAFFSNVSHEFRTPLTLMLGPLQELSMLERDELRTPLVELAQRNALRLLKLVNTLLDFSRLEAGRDDAAFAETDLVALTCELCGLFRSGVEHAGLRLTFDGDSEARAFVDRAMWEKIVLNLLSNAFKFTFAGEIRVTIAARGDAIELAVADTGVGIPQAEIPHLFERFHRVRGTKSRSHEGSGIGLALVAELVRLHGGSIEVSSALDCGTTFRVSVPTGSAHLDAAKIAAGADALARPSAAPYYLADLEATIARADPSGAAPPAANGTSRRRILLADDNGDLREYVARLLASRYDVVTVRNGAEALVALREGPCDLIVSDAMMPEMDGFALLAAVRRDPEFDRVPFVMLSARAGEEAAVEGLERGADDYLIKPFSAEQLLARVTALLNAAEIRERAMRELRASEERFRNLAVSMPHIVVETDALGAVTFMNETYRAFTGQAPESGYGTAWTAAVHPDDRPDLLATWRNAVASGTAFRAEYRMCRHDGSYRWHVADLRPQRDADGRVLRFTGTIADIDDQRRAVQERELLSEAGRILAQSLDLRTTLDNIARLTVPHFADWCQISVGTADGLIRVVSLAHRDPRKEELARGVVGRLHVNKDAPTGSPYVIRTGRSELIEDSVAVVKTLVPSDAQVEIYRDLGLGSTICVPLTVRGKTLGAIAAIYGESGRHYTPEDLPVLEELGRRAGLAVHNATEFEREHRVAESFQEASLPLALPEVDGVSFDAVYLPAGDDARVGGDWYDAMRLFDGRIVISIGDVTGHGLSAAVTMGNIRQIIRGIAQVYAEPAFMLGAADRALRLEHPDQFVTAFVGVLDPIVGTLTYASAGHPPPVLRKPNGDAEFLCDTRLPLGLWRDSGHGAGHVVSVPSGSHIVLYTDGLTEYERNPLAGEARLLELAGDGRFLAAPHPATALKEAFLRGGAARDDVAILVTCVNAPGIAADDTRLQRWAFDAGDAIAAQRARREFAAALRARGATASRADVAEVVFGELLGNAARHAPGIVDVLVDWNGSAPVLHVFDRGPGFAYAPRLPSDVFSETGRGLYIVSLLSDYFHVSKGPGGGTHARAVLSLAG